MAFDVPHAAVPKGRLQVIYCLGDNGVTDGLELPSRCGASPHFSPVREMIALEFVFTRNFLIERNSRAYFRVRKIPCGNKDQARAHVAGEKCGLVCLDGPLKDEIPGL